MLRITRRVVSSQSIRLHLCWIMVGFSLVPASSFAAESNAVSFTSHILPLLQKNCLACHNESEYEGELILESVEQLLSGGDSGPTVIAGNAEESLIYQLASHQEEPIMPPLDNDVGAKRLTAEELDLLKKWINEGAGDKPTSAGVEAGIRWRPIRDEHASVLALELSPNGRWLASGRGNRLLVYSVPRKKLHQTLVDPNLPQTHAESAHLDSVQSTAWNSDATMLASGGYRVVKIWQRQAATTKERPTEVQTELNTPDGKYQIKVLPANETSIAKLIQIEGEKEIASLPASLANQDSLDRLELEHALRTQNLNVCKSDVEAAKQANTDAEKDVTKADEEIKKATEAVTKKKEELKTAEAELKKHDETIQEAESKLDEISAQLKQLSSELASAEDKTELETKHVAAEAEQKKTQEQLKNAKQPREKAQQEVDKKQQELTDAEKASERSKAAKMRLERIVVTRQSDIEQAHETQKQQQAIVDESAKTLEAARQAATSPWVHVTLSEDGSEFSLLNAEGTQASFTTASGELLSLSSAAAGGSWKLIKTLGDPDGESPFSDRVTSLAFRHDGKVLAIGGGEPSRSGEVQLWNAETWERIGVVKDIHSDVVYDLQFAPLGKQLVSCASDRMVKLIDGETAKHLRTFEGHTGHVLGVSWRADGRTLATAGADQVVKVWDAKEGGQKKTISGFKGEVTAVRYLGLDNRMVFSTGRGELHSRDSEGNSKPGFGKLTDYVHRVSCSRDGQVIAAAGTNRTIRVWQADGKQLAEFQ